MSSHRFKYLFRQFVDNTATQEETEEFLSMMNRDNYDEDVKILLDEFWNQSTSVSPLEKNKAEKIFNKIMLSTPGQKTVPMYRRKDFWLKAIAAIAIVSLSVLFYQREVRTSDRLVKAEANKVSQPVKPGRRFISLPDGSTVILNENSSLVLSNDFITSGKREVYLEGEGFFDVAEDEEHPFIVHTGKLETTVLGTAFNVASNSIDGSITVTVSRGKVQVGDDKRTYNVLLPNEQIVVDKGHSNHQKRPVKAEEVTAWKNEDIYFDDVSIKDVVNQLEERFDVSIIFSNDVIQECRFSATFLKTQTLGQILKVIGEFNNLEYKFSANQTVILDGPGCK